MDAAATATASQLVYCGIEPLRRTCPAASKKRAMPSGIVAFRRPNGVVRAVATDPKPNQTESSGSSPRRGVVNGSSRSPPVNGVSTVVAISVWMMNVLISSLLTVFVCFFCFFFVFGFMAHSVVGKFRKIKKETATRSWNMRLGNVSGLFLFFLSVFSGTEERDVFSSLN